jgi:hypothetical protein
MGCGSYNVSEHGRKGNRVWVHFLFWHVKLIEKDMLFLHF